MKKYKYICVKDTPSDKHIHCNRLIKGNTYLISKTDDKKFVSITGILQDKDGGIERVYDRHINISQVSLFVEQL